MKIAVITGADQGIGLAIARRIQKDGYHVVALDRVAQTAERTAELVGGTACIVDVSDDESVGQCAAMIRDTFGSVDVLVKNAGYWRQETFEEGTEEGARDRLLATLPIPRSGEPEDVADLVSPGRARLALHHRRGDPCRRRIRPPGSGLPTCMSRSRTMGSTSV